MGLDQYAYKVKKGHITSTVDFTFTSFNDSSGEWEQIIPESDYAEIAYWRKHHDLQGWMKKLYNEKGGSDSQFNCNKLLLTIEDLADLEYEVENNSLPSTTGFFFGHDNTEYYENETLSFIENARNAINEGYDIVYDSWW
jgi:hypothetical protein